jgi:Type I restriction modification DNA specificity domain
MNEPGHTLTVWMGDQVAGHLHHHPTTNRFAFAYADAWREARVVDLFQIGLEAMVKSLQGPACIASRVDRRADAAKVLLHQVRASHQDFDKLRLGSVEGAFADAASSGLAPIREVLNRTKSSVGQLNISLSQCLAFELPVPPAEEQAEIVRRVETLFAFADRLEARLQAAQTATERLTPALLAKSFRGELVPQDPNDEPASELLKRLAAATSSPAPKRGRKKSADAAA